MTQTKRNRRPNKARNTSALRTLKTTTMVGAISLTLVGWVLLSRAEASNAAETASQASVSTDATSLESLARALPADTSKPTRHQAALSGASKVEKTGEAEEGVESEVATENKIALDIVRWVQSTTGDSVAVVRDSRGLLWYVWASDVQRIEQGLSPQRQPLAVRQQARTRHS